jgi:uncharacterized RDD family membrane protein YckC
VQTASLGRRLGAYIVDGFVATFSAVALGLASYPPARLSEDPGDTLFITGFYIVEVTLLTGLLGYSIGKRLFGLRVENPAGKPIGLVRALVRTMLQFLILPVLVMNEDRRGLHDLAVGSRVIPASAAVQQG